MYDEENSLFDESNEQNLVSNFKNQYEMGQPLATYALKETESVFHTEDRIPEKTHNYQQKLLKNNKNFQTKNSPYGRSNITEKKAINPGSINKNNFKGSLKRKLKNNNLKMRHQTNKINRRTTQPRTITPSSESNKHHKNYNTFHGSKSQYDNNTAVHPRDNFISNPTNNTDYQQVQKPVNVKNQNMSGRVTVPCKSEVKLYKNHGNINQGEIGNMQAISQLDNFGNYNSKKEDQELNLSINNDNNANQNKRDFGQNPQKSVNPNLVTPIQMKIEDDVSGISLPNVKSNVTLYHDMNTGNGPQNNQKLCKREFVFKYNSDKNGLFYFLGSKGNQSKYVNPFEIGELKVFVSSLAQGDYSNFVGRSLTNCRTCNEENAFLGVDLGKNRSLIPKHYTIRNRDSSQYVLLNWTLEASPDFKKWYMVDRRVHQGDNLEHNQAKAKQREMLLERGAVTTWTVPLDDLKKIIKSITPNYKSFRGFRYFRVRQIGKNSSNSFNLALSGFELYGTSYGIWKFE